MTLRKSILLLIALTTIAALVGCSSSSNQPLTLTLNTVPTSLQVNSQTALVASVDNDKANGGVVWSCTTTPTGSPCGSFNPATTASGASTTYTAPNFVLPSGTTITITASSATNSAISQSSQPISISAASLADGNYVFSVTGYDYSDESNYTVTGVITVASGAITGGEQDFVDDDFQIQDTISAQTASSCNAPIAATCLTTAPTGAPGDGNLYIYLATGDNDIGVGGLETFTGSVLPLAEGANAGKAALAEFDGSATGSGWVERQSGALSLTATPGAGSFAFVLGNAGNALSIGGIINIDDLPATSGGPATVGTISGAGSIWDADAEGNVIQGAPFSASSVSAGDGLGRVLFTMNSPDFSQLVLAGYQISSSKIVLVETVDNFEGVLAGIAYGQSVPSTNGVKGFVLANAENTYVIGMQGADEANFILQSAEQLTINSDGSVTGFLDFNDFSGLQTVSPDPVSAPVASATVDLTGRVTIPGVAASDEAALYNIQLYLDGNGHALAITLDGSDSQAGIGFQQSGASSIAASSFAGPYGMGVTGWDFNEDGEFDSVGPVVADGSSTFAGFSDVNWLDYFDPGPITVEGNQVSGGFGTSSASGIFSGTIGGIDMANCVAFTPTTEGTCAPDNFNFYLIDQYGDNIAIETDGNQLTFGYIVQQ
jgi:hypothetical protein